MCKILGLLCMFLGCSLWGMGRAMEYKQREQNTYYLIYILDCLVSQIVYQQSTLEDCMYELSGKVKEPFGSCFLGIYEKVRENTQQSPLRVMEQELSCLLEELHISREIAGLFVECFGCGGFQDRVGMEKVLKGMKERLQEFHAGALEESRKQSRLSVYLGMFGGMFCVILCL